MSVIIPTYNRREIVIRAVESVLRQTKMPDEIIVVDDGSTDGTAEKLKEYGSRITCIQQKNAGVSNARNKGVEHSTGSIVAFLDSDDVWLPRMAEVVSAALERYPEAVAASANGLVKTAKSATPLFSLNGPKCKSKEPVQMLSGTMAALMQPVTSGIHIRRQALNAAAPFDPSVLEYEDFDLWSRLSLIGSWVFCHEPLWEHYREAVDEINVSSQYKKFPIRSYRSLLHSYERLLTIPNVEFLERCKLKKVIGNLRGIIGAMESDSGEATGSALVFRSIFDWPSPRRIARSAAMLMGWRPPEIRNVCNRLRAVRSGESVERPIAIQNSESSK